MKLAKRLTLLTVAVALSLPGYGRDVTKVGTTAAPFLGIGVGARPLALGGAFVSIADDASALYWNVAGVAKQTRPQIIFNHSDWLADINFDYAGIVVPAGYLGTFGVSLTSLSMDDMEQTTEDQPNGTGVEFGVSSVAFGLHYARALTDRFSIGFTGKYIRESIWNSSASGMAVDVGTLFETPFWGLRLGMAITNFGTKMRMAGDDLLIQVDPDPTISGNNERINANLETGRFDLPLNFRFGMSMDVVDTEQSRLTVAVDATHPNDNAESVDAGFEYVFNNFVALRGGYRNLFIEDSEQGFTVGGGINYRLQTFGFLLDYAYEDFGRLENIQKFTIQLLF